MATVRQCERALRVLAKRLAELDTDLRRKHSVDRTLQCTVTDLSTCFSGRVCDGELLDLAIAEAPDAQIKLTVSSDDLVALVEGQLGVTAAWTSGRLRVDASMLDLIRLRSLV
jgi:putative sterol carrier protein